MITRIRTSVKSKKGDIPHSTNSARDLVRIASWIDIAGQAGAKASRVIAKADFDEEGLMDSNDYLRYLKLTGFDEEGLMDSND